MLGGGIWGPAGDCVGREPAAIEGGVLWLAEVTLR